MRASMFGRYERQRYSSVFNNHEDPREGKKEEKVGKKISNIILIIIYYRNIILIIYNPSLSIIFQSLLLII